MKIKDIMRLPDEITVNDIPYRFEYFDIMVQQSLSKGCITEDDDLEIVFKAIQPSIMTYNEIVDEMIKFYNVHENILGHIDIDSYAKQNNYIIIDNEFWLDLYKVKQYMEDLR